MFTPQGLNRKYWVLVNQLLRALHQVLFSLLPLQIQAHLHNRRLNFSHVPLAHLDSPILLVLLLSPGLPVPLVSLAHQVHLIFPALLVSPTPLVPLISLALLAPLLSPAPQVLQEDQFLHQLARLHL